MWIICILIYSIQCCVFVIFQTIVNYRWSNWRRILVRLINTRNNKHHHRNGIGCLLRRCCCMWHVRFVTVFRAQMSTFTLTQTHIIRYTTTCVRSARLVRVFVWSEPCLHVRDRGKPDQNVYMYAVCYVRCGVQFTHAQRQKACARLHKIRALRVHFRTGAILRRQSVCDIHLYGVYTYKHIQVFLVALLINRISTTYFVCRAFGHCATVLCPHVGDNFRFGIYST